MDKMNKVMAIAAIVAMMAAAVVVMSSDDSNAEIGVESFEYDDGFLTVIPSTTVVNGTVDATIAGSSTPIFGYSYNGVMYFNVGSTVDLVPGETYTLTFVVNNDSGSVTFTVPSESGETPDPEPTEYTVTFVADGTTVNEVKVIDGQTVTAIDAPGKDGYTFQHWSLASDGEAYDFDTPVTGDLTLYAVYTVNETPEPDPVLESIKIGGEFKTSYTVGDVLDLSGITVTAVYDDGSEVPLTADDYVIDDSEVDMGTAGTYAIGISYGGMTETITITVSAATGGDDDDDTPVTPTDMEEVTITGTYYSQETRFTSNQVVIVDGTLTIYSGASIIIEGQLVVPAGSTIIVEAGGMIYLDGKAVGVEYVAEIDGTIIIEEEDSDLKAGLVRIISGTMTVGGSVDVYGDLVVDDGIVVEQDGVVTVEAEGRMTGQEVTVRGTLEIYGDLVADEVRNHGTVLFDSEVAASGDVTVYMMSSGATVQVTTYTTDGTAGLTITDQDLVFRGSGDNEVNVGNHDGTYANEVSVSLTAPDGEFYAQFSGLTVTAGASSTGSGANIRYTNSLDVSGSLTVAAVYYGTGNYDSGNASADVTLSEAGDGRNHFTVSGAMTVGSRVTVTNQGTLDVSGSVTATGSTANPATLANEGEITLEGDGIITVSSAISHESGEGTVNATRYSTTGTGAVTVYVTIDTALATVAQDGNTITQLTALNENTVTVSAVLPSGVTLNTANATVNIGERNGSDVVLTIQSGASVRGAATVIDVRGTLYAENQSNIQSATQERILADVKSVQTDDSGKVVKNGWAKWTNIYTAMAEAQAGDVVEVFRPTGYVDVSQNLTVPADVTLVVPSTTATLRLADGVTLTINGTLRTAQDVLAESRFGTSALDIAGTDTTEARQSSAIVVNGYLYTAVGALYGDSVDGEDVGMSAGAPIAGAYYEVEGYSAISPLEQAVAVLEDINGDITVFGAVSAGDVTLAATDYCDTLTVSSRAVSDMNGNAVATSLTVGSLTLAGATLVAEGTITGTVVAGDAYAELAAVSGITVADDDGMEVTGTVTGGTTSSVAFTAGAASADSSAVFLVPVTVAEGATVTSAGAWFSDLTVAGTVDVAAGSSVSATTATISAGGLIDVGANETARFDTLYVYGTLSVAEATSTSNYGTATAGFVGIGISMDDVSKGVAGSAGIVEGTLSATVGAIVAPGTTVSEATLASLGGNATAFQVEGSVWFTFYSDAASIEDLPTRAPVENAVVIGWEAEDGTVYQYDEYGHLQPDSYATSSYSVLDAVVDFDIYTIVVTADAGIGSIAIDGVVLVNLGNMFVTTSPIAAGNHSVTYTLKSGYEGSATLSSGSSYASVSGLTFTLSGMDDGGYTTVQLSLSGTTASDSSIIVNVDGGSDDGLGLTDILLIVLVILIIVMAIIVALRLMRS